ncbi:uncharacterized protein B0I36DRAFT_272154 [Microdochium trichocladiopsis]|uniref:Uncharacterized protein n=1 Tax=Microdochium trichocladiopsis TaxID=1682393 RepID=A0A9P8Y1W9_9PEZI|nr:uncharacterized protein B0I36DRAFT_272154 [Microdochium trichocladiopsis]KAH7025643.1 hypothetical protein B0I36DRAFT_272154 [Microdochium trichocladiopsis]
MQRNAAHILLGVEDGPAVLVDIVPMYSSMTEALGPQDDWTGIKERADRRKIQSRLNVRAHRKRKAFEAKRLVPNVAAPRRRKPRIETVSSIASSPTSSARERQEQISDEKSTKNHIASRRVSCLQSGTPWMRLEGPFPLGRDHLIPLIQYNVFRAVATNVQILHSFDALFQPPPKGSCVLDSKLVKFPGPSSTESLPESLRPTWLQRTVPHGSWIETLPHPQMRDNAILAASSFDYVELLADVFGGMCFHQEESSGGNGVLVWKDPWHPIGWELTEGFARKWRVLLDGCDDMLHATNYWRLQRGEDAIDWQAL